MKVLRVINSLEMGGAERSIETNVPIHIKNGISVDVLLLSGARTPFYESLISKGVTIYVTSKTSIYNPWNIIKIIPYLRKYDIVHVHTFPAFYWVCFAKLLSFSNTTLVYTEHSTSNRRRNKPIFKLIDRFVFSRYKHIISISDATTKNLIKYIGHNHCITTIYNGVDFKPYNQVITPIELFPGSGNYRIITQIASFRYPKDQKTTIKSLIYLDPSVHAVFVGTGATMDYCKELSEELGVADRVHFLGIRTDVPTIVASSDIIVMSSIYEGFGRAAVEGMAGRKPVIASNVPGLRDIVSGAGLLFTSQKDNELAECIRRLLASSTYYDEVAKNCHERAGKYNVDRMIDGYENVYRSVKRCQKLL